MAIVPLRACCTCGQEKPLSGYYRDATRPDGYSPRCKACQTANYLAHKQAHRATRTARETTETHRAANYAYRLTRRDAANARRREMRAARRVVRLEEQRIERERTAEERECRRRGQARVAQANWRQSHPEVVRESNRRSRATHAATHHAATAQWKRDNPDKVRASCHERRARLRGSVGKFTAEEWAAIKQSQEFRCLYCGRPEPEIKLTVDHILPISKGGSNYATNIQGLCLTCNCRKHDRVS